MLASLGGVRARKFPHQATTYSTSLRTLGVYAAQRPLATTTRPQIARSIRTRPNSLVDYSTVPETYSTMSVTKSTDPLVWIDCEMTGLNPSTDSILSIACYVTDYKLNLLDQNGCQAIIATPKTVLDNMGEWCQKTHGQNGLTEACLSSSAIPANVAASDVLAYIRKHVPEARKALLAGNSVHADKMFLMQQPWTAILDHLHYRLLDVSAIKEAARRWCSAGILDQVPGKKTTHSANEDILESIAEAKYYMSLFERLR